MPFWLEYVKATYEDYMVMPYSRRKRLIAATEDRLKKQKNTS